MALFQQSIIKKYLQELDNNAVNTAFDKFYKHFGNTERQNNIRELKEEQYQEGFLRELFVNILGYTINPEPNYNLLTELKNKKDSKKADGAIINQGADSPSIIAVIELKGTDTTDLSKVENQAFGYKNNQKDCKYVIISNFEKLRFYIDNAIDFEEFNLFNLTKERFQLLYLCLSKDNLLSGIPQKIKEASVSQEENITKKLYSDYSTFKRTLYQNLVELNPQYDKLTLFKKTQKLLDRFLFIFFAEDRLLLPPNSIREILKQWNQLKDLDNYTPLYDRFKKYFGYMNTGFKGKQYEIFAYNGGFFAPDEILDNIKIDDKILHDHTLRLSNYDFDTEVDVNILGHIFEHSLNEIEEIQSEIEGKELDKTKTKRKKDGVFYTPKYITKYIVENTVGALCTEKKIELEINEEEIIISKRKDKKKELIEKIDTYRNWLLKLTICDPACGSGAFLNQALDYLIIEHKKLDELKARITNSSMILSDIENSVLENNIFGVDLNDEAVEIAKLSLWLKTAQKGRKLSVLTSNIKCGNSLIDDKIIAGEKAFNWQNEFPEIFANGGFDVIIGNPPYVVLSSFEDDSFKFLQDKYKTSFGRLNTFALFLEKVTFLVQLNSKIGLIIPDSICLIDYYTNLRKYLLDTTSIEQIIELGDGIFEDATVPAIILILGLKKSESKIFIGNNATLQFSANSKCIMQDYYYTTPKYSYNLTVDDIFLKLNNSIDSKSVFSLKDLIQIKIGVCTGGNNQHISDSPIFINSKKMLQGKDINRYCLSYSNKHLNYDRKALLRARDEDIFLKPEKLFMRQTSDKLILCYDNEQYYSIDSLFILYSKDERINLKYLLALLNSKLLNRQYQKLNPEAGRVFAQVKIDYVNELPIVLCDSIMQLDYIQKVDLMLLLNKELNELNSKYLNLLKTKYCDLKISNKIENWSKITFKEFIKELEKQKFKMSLSEQSEWLEFFEKEKLKVTQIQALINKTDNEIDQMVYELYGLNEDEIKII